MKRDQSVNEVIWKGQLMINVPVIWITVSVMAIVLASLDLLVLEPQFEILKLVGAIVGLLLAITSGWIWWSFQITKWRIWAFENTKQSDWKYLKQRAIDGRLIWEEGSYFEKTEIRSLHEQRKIERIHLALEAMEEKKFWNELKDDPAIPERVDYHFDKNKMVPDLVIASILVLIGIILTSMGDLLLGGLSLVNGVLQLDFTKIYKIRKEDNPLSIGEEGIAIQKFERFGLIRWEDIGEINVDTNSGKVTLEIWHEDEWYELSLDLSYYDVGHYDEFLRTINVYLKRRFD